jgi:hypothetical protein
MQHTILQHVKKEALHLVAYSMSYSLLYVELDKLPRWTNCPGLLIGRRRVSVCVCSSPGCHVSSISITAEQHMHMHAFIVLRAVAKGAV